MPSHTCTAVTCHWRAWHAGAWPGAGALGWERRGQGGCSWEAKKPACGLWLGKIKVLEKKRLFEVKWVAGEVKRTEWGEKRIQ